MTDKQDKPSGSWGADPVDQAQAEIVYAGFWKILWATFFERYICLLSVLVKPNSLSTNSRVGMVTFLSDCGSGTFSSGVRAVSLRRSIGYSKCS